MFNLDGIEFLSSSGLTTITLDVTPEQMELAIASNGASLHDALMLALVVAMTVDSEAH